jgi:hypothetical protein
VSASAGHLPWKAPIHAVGLPWPAVYGGSNDMATYKWNMKRSELMQEAKGKKQVQLG